MTVLGTGGAKRKFMLTKAAQGVGAPSDMDFETTIADLAHAQLRDRAPALLDYLLGFQVIDKNDDDTHAVGVMGFKIGEQMLFVPCFFLNGELKQSLLYIKNQDLFVPLQDNWVTYLLNRRPFVMGQREPRKEQELGVMGPDLSHLSNTQGGGGHNQMFGMRQASWREPWARQHADGVGKMFAKLGSRYAGLPSLTDFLSKTAAYDTNLLLMKSMRQDLDFANTVLKFYPFETLKTACSAPAMPRRGRRRSTPMAKKSGFLSPPSRSPLLTAMRKKSQSGSVRVLHGPRDAQRPLLPDSDRERLLRGDLVFKDAREETNKAYRVSEGFSLQNPNDNGQYELLLDNGEFKTVYIFVAPKAMGKGYSRVFLVVDKESKNFDYFWPEYLWVRPYQDNKSDDEHKIYEDASPADSMTPGNIYTLVTKDNRASLAFKVIRKNSGKMTELFVEPIIKNPGFKPYGYPEIVNDEDVSQFGLGPRRPFIGDVALNTSGMRPGEETYQNSQVTGDKQPEFQYLSHIILTDDDRKLRVIGNTLFAPASARVIALKEGSQLDTWMANDPGNLIDVEINLMKEGAVPLSLLRKRASYYVGEAGPFSKIQLITSLVKKAGLRGDDAVYLVNKLPENKRFGFLIKNNIGYSPPIPEPDRGFDEYAGVTEQYPQDELLPFDNYMDPNPQEYMGKPERQQIMEAAQTGQKDIFDTSAIASLVRTSDSQDLITQYLSDIILGLDRVNRVMFMYYWLNDQFRDRYGQENLVELEDQLKSVSKSLGDLVLFLKQRKVEGSPSFDAMEINLGAR